MRLKQCFARAKPFRMKKIKKQQQAFDWLLLIFKKSQVLQNEAWILKFGFKNSKLATMHVTSDYMRPPLWGRRSCCVTRPGIKPPWLSEEIRTVHFVVCLQFVAYYLILLDLQLINFPRTCMISREALSWFPHFLQPCLSATNYTRKWRSAELISFQWWDWP